MPDGIGGQHALLHQLPAGQGQRHKAAGDGCGAGSAVALEHVAVDGDGMLPSFARSTAARRERPTSRWISALRGESFSLAMSRLLRSRLARGSMEYSAVTQPVPSGTWGGTRSSTLAQQRTMVSPHWMRQLPSANFYEIRGDFDRAQLVKRPSVLSGHGMRSFSFSPQRDWIAANARS